MPCRAYGLHRPCRSRRATSSSRGHQSVIRGVMIACDPASGISHGWDQHVAADAKHAGVICQRREPLAGFRYREGRHVALGASTRGARCMRRAARVRRPLFSEDHPSSAPTRGRGARAATPFVSVLHVDDLGAVRWHEAANYRPLPLVRWRMLARSSCRCSTRASCGASVVPHDYEEILCSSEFGHLHLNRCDPLGGAPYFYPDERVKRDRLAPSVGESQAFVVGR